AQLGLSLHLDQRRLLLHLRAARSWLFRRGRCSRVLGPGPRDERAGTGSGPLKIMCRVDGSSDLAKETLGHFEGWRDSRPVRIGNGAGDQLQLDIYGEAMGAVFLGDAHGVQIDHEGWLAVSDAIGWVYEHWGQ